MENLNESSLLELLELYMEMVEKQDEIICRLSRITTRQAQEIQHLKNLYDFVDMDPGFELDKKIAGEVMQEYQKMRN